jgi:hypothetical protein
MKIEFLASLPPIQSAIKIDGSDGNARVQLDIPASELPNMVKIPAFCSQKRLKVIIEPMEDE